jgi:hypothetical protein
MTLNVLSGSMNNCADTVPPPDPFGLWSPTSTQIGAGTSGEVSFSMADETGGVEGSREAVGSPAAVWQLPLVSGTGEEILGEDFLALREGQVRAIETGLSQASIDLDVFLARRDRQKQAGNTNFAIPNVATLSFAPGTEQSPEDNLALALAECEPAGSEAVNFAAGFGGVDWEALQEKYEAMVASVNRQILHLAWVDTTLDGRLVAHTAVGWGGDMQTYIRPLAEASLVSLHSRSLAAALASREANLRTVLTVATLAGKIALAPTNPLQMIQALSLGWQFVSQTIMPLLKRGNNR